MNQTSPYWNRRVRRLRPYVPGEQPQDRRYTKLNTNENPYPPSSRVREALREAIDQGLHLYPDPDARQLKNRLAKTCGVNPDQVFVGNGSDEVLAHAFAGLFDQDSPVYCPDIGYSFYPVYARFYDLMLERVPLNADFELDLEAYPDGAQVVFANPNAPTSLALGRDPVGAYLERNRNATVIVDEAYVDFGAESCVPLVAHCPNLLVVQTFSKSRGLAGLRVGFAIGQAPLIEALERIKNSFNSYPLDRLAQSGACAALDDGDAFTAHRTAIIATRARSTRELESLGFSVLPSSANFLFAQPGFMPAEQLYRALKSRGVLVRHFQAPRIKDYVRITVGTDEEMATLFEAIRSLRVTE